VIDDALPPSVVMVRTDADLLDVPLFPEEESALGRPVEKRRREFVTARACARRALEQLGVEPAPIASGPRGEPLWPAGVVGSITHCRVLRACAVARAEEMRSIGIDAEVHDSLPDGVLRLVASPDEQARIREAPDGLCLDRVLFSAKEAIYKAWYPLARRWLGFDDVDLSLSLDERTFHARLLVPGPQVDGGQLTGFDGRWRVDGDVVFCAVVVAA